MKFECHSLPDGTVTSPGGFTAGAVSAGIKTRAGALDLGILFSQLPCTAAGLFTQNKVKAAPVVHCQERLGAGRARAVVVNSGCANACTGEQGLIDTAQTARMAADTLEIVPEEVLVASTGVIGVALPMERIGQGLRRVKLSDMGGHDLARAMMTTDTFAKETAVRLELGSEIITIGGVAKGAGMIHPNMATLLSFITTDAALDADFARTVLRKAADQSFNMISVDGDTSTNDTLLFLANGACGASPLRPGTARARAFVQALTEVCVFLAKCIARDGEGATKLMEVRVEGAASVKDARVAARTIATSPLVKAALHGGDPNWGRILAAAGRSGAAVDPLRADLYLDGYCLMQGGCPVPFDEEAAATILRLPEVVFRLCLNLGDKSATAWGCDLSREYVTINSDYTT